MLFWSSCLEVSLVQLCLQLCSRGEGGKNEREEKMRKGKVWQCRNTVCFGFSRYFQGLGWFQGLWSIVGVISLGRGGSTVLRV